MKNDWKSLKRGDRIRIGGFSEEDKAADTRERSRLFRAGEDKESAETRRDFNRVMRRLIEKKRGVEISWIDPLGHPWFDYFFVERGKLRRHSISICDNDSWIRIDVPPNARKKLQQIEKLKKLAQAATQGRWKVSGRSIVTDKFCIATIEDDGGYEAPERDANAQFIATCAPNEILKLIDLLEDAIAGNWEVLKK